ncbi:MAG TPA: hypothetical protein P5250_01930 [Bacteroidales bacterium]|nr:hypothetical protein [Bacteroidales bacterium]
MDNTFLEILKYTLPSIVVFLASYFIIKSFIDNEKNRRKDEAYIKEKEKLMELKIAEQKIISPIRLQAYERLVLFLERISPGSLIMRNNTGDMNAFQFQMALIKNIRDEFEHNLSQQLYISTKAWDLIRNAKEEMIRLINTSAARCNENSNATDLAQIIFQLSLEDEKTSISKALEYLKEEARKLF